MSGHLIAVSYGGTSLEAWKQASLDTSIASCSAEFRRS